MRLWLCVPSLLSIVPVRHRISFSFPSTLVFLSVIIQEGGHVPCLLFPLILRVRCTNIMVRKSEHLAGKPALSPGRLRPTLATDHLAAFSQSLLSLHSPVRTRGWDASCDQSLFTNWRVCGRGRGTAPLPEWRMGSPACGR